jgi:hypothetical protein
MEDDNLESGLDAVDETEEVSPEEEESELSPLEIARRYRQVNVRKTEAAEELKRQLEAARNVLLQQPTQMSRSDKLLGIASTLLAPGPVGRAGTIGESLGSLGKYFTDVSTAEREAKQAQAEALSKFDIQRVQQEKTAAEAESKELAGLMGKYIGIKPEKEPEQIRTDRIKAKELGITLPELYRREAAEKRLLAGRGGAGAGEDKYVNEFSILQDPTAKPAEKSAALARLPPDVRKNWQAAGKNDASYADRIEQLQSFTLPDVKRAIEMIKENPRLSAGTLAAFIKGTPIVGQAATDLDNTLSVIRSAVGFDKLEELKKLSPYGASGLGAVSNAEQKLLQSVKGSLEQDNSARNLIYNLERLQRFYEDSVPTIIASQGIDLEAIRSSGAQGGAPAPAAGGAGELGISADAIRAERERRKKQRGGQ